MSAAGAVTPPLRAGAGARHATEGPGRGSRARRWVSPLAVAAIAGLTAGTAVLVRRVLFPFGSLNRDESVYLDFARMILDGRVTLDAVTHSSFAPWASGIVDGRVVLKYTPLWPAVIAVFEAVGQPTAAPAMAAAALVAVVYQLARTALNVRDAVIAAGLAGLSPFVIVQGATLLPYVFHLALATSAGAFLLRGAARDARTGSRLHLAAGFVFGLAAFARTFDAVVVVGAFFVVTALHDRRVIGWFALGAALPLAALAVYNATTMGSPFRLPFTVTGETDAYGFGRRGVFAESTVPFSLGDGVEALAANGGWLAVWVFGGPVTVALAVLGAARTPPSLARRALLLLAVALPVAYLPFWGSWAVVHFWRGAASLGPFYHLPLLVPLVVFAARGVGSVLERRPRIFGSALAISLLAVTAVLVPAKLAPNRAATDVFERAAEALRRAPPGVVLLPDRGRRGFDSWTASFGNDPALDQPVLYADAPGGGAVFGVLDEFDRRGRADRGRVTQLLMSPTVQKPDAFRLVPVWRPRGASITLAADVTNRDVRSLYVGDGTSERRLDDAAPTVVLHASELTSARGVLSVGVEDGRGGRHEWRIPYRLVGSDVEVVLPGWGHHRRGRGWAAGDASDWLRVELRNVGAEQRQ